MHGEALEVPPAEPEPHERPRLRDILTLTVAVSALGYFVDVYDLLLFSIVRVPSLTDLGVPPEAMLEVGVLLLNAQMGGLLLGGILWGVLGDKRGRLSVLFGSIALYSAANLANAFVTDTTQYAVLRFVAGVGLAGELGAAVTLVSEGMSPATRGYGTAVISGFGILGAVAAAGVAAVFDWRTSYIVGGVLGLALLLARLKLVESGMFRTVARSDAARGDLRMLVNDRGRFAKYMHCILVGLPIWFTVGVVMTFAPELGRALGSPAPVSAATAVLTHYVGGAIGGFAAGWLSGVLRTRRWIMWGAITLMAGLLFVLLFWRGITPQAYYGVAFVMGLGLGYWSVFVTNAAEQFGTNLRATVTTTVPNFIRGSVVPITIAVTAIAAPLGLVRAVMLVGAACVLIALWSLRSLPETYGKDLDYVET